MDIKLVNPRVGGIKKRNYIKRKTKKRNSRKLKNKNIRNIRKLKKKINLGKIVD